MRPSLRDCNAHPCTCCWHHYYFYYCCVLASLAEHSQPVATTRESSEKESWPRIMSILNISTRFWSPATAAKEKPALVGQQKQEQQWRRKNCGRQSEGQAIFVRHSCSGHFVCQLQIARIVCELRTRERWTSKRTSLHLSLSLSLSLAKRQIISQLFKGHAITVANVVVVGGGVAHFHRNTHSGTVDLAARCRQQQPTGAQNLHHQLASPLIHHSTGWFRQIWTTKLSCSLSQSNERLTLPMAKVHRKTCESIDDDDHDELCSSGISLAIGHN